MSESKRWHRFTAGACSSLLLASTIVMTALNIYSHNSYEFTFKPVNFFIASMAILLGIFFLLLLLQGSFYRYKHFSRLQALLLATALALYLQTNFLAEFFPGMQFNALPLNGFTWSLIVFQLVVLTTPFFLAFYFHLFIKRHAWKLCLILLAAQASPIVKNLWQTESRSYDFQEYTIDEREKFLFAQENVIVVVVDCMGENLFKEMLQDYPEIATIFKDFTCFDRILSPIPNTMFAVPALLTGVEFNDKQQRNERTHAEYLQQAFFSQDSLLLNFRQEGYKTEAYPFIMQTVCYHPDLLNNIKTRSSKQHRQSLQVLADILMAKMIPMPLQPFLESGFLSITDRFVTPRDNSNPLQIYSEGFDVYMYNKEQKEMQLGKEPKGFKYLHLQGAHKDWRTNENLETVPASDPVSQLRGSMKILEFLLQRLQQWGIYDQTLLVISGDHSEIYNPEIVSLIKRPGDRHAKLEFNSLPCLISDLAATILAEKGLRDASLSLFSRPAIHNDLANFQAYHQFSRASWDNSGWQSFDLPEETAEKEFFAGRYSIQKKELLLSVPDGFSGQINKFHLQLKGFKQQYSWRISYWLKAELSKNELLFLPSIALAKLPDDSYQATVIIEYSENENEPEFMEEQKLNQGKTLNNLLPEFLSLQNGKASFSATIPDLKPEPLAINAILSFQPLQFTPQITLSPDCKIKKDHIIMTDESQFTLYLPETERQLICEISSKILSSIPLVVQFYHQDQLVHQQNSKTNTPDLNSSFRIPEAASQNHKLQLKIKAKPRFPNRNQLRRQAKVQILKLKLTETK